MTDEILRKNQAETIVFHKLGNRVELLITRHRFKRDRIESVDLNLEELNKLIGVIK